MNQLYFGLLTASLILMLSGCKPGTPHAKKGYQTMLMLDKDGSALVNINTALLSLPKRTAQILL